MYHDVIYFFRFLIRTKYQRITTNIFFFLDILIFDFSKVVFLSGYNISRVQHTQKFYVIRINYFFNRYTGVKDLNV